jgi:hypothetical protein
LNTQTMTVLVALATSATGCAGLDDIRFRLLTDPPGEAQLTFDQITMQEGIALAVRAIPISGDEPIDADIPMELLPTNPFVLGVSATELGDEDDDVANRSFVIHGASQGSTEISVFIDGELEAEIPALVGPQ